jgi:hypothetical protein
MKRFGATILSWALLFCLAGKSAQAGDAKQTDAEWKNATDAAKKDAQLTVYHTRGPFDKLFADFNKRYPAIQFLSASGRGGELISRMMSEK